METEPSRPHGGADALRATAGAGAVLLGGLLLAGMLVLLGGELRGEQPGTPATLQLQLVVQATALITGAFVLAAALGLARCANDPRRVRLPFGTRGIVVAAAVGAGLALAVTPLVDLVWPELRDPVATVDQLAIGERQLSDVVTLLLLVGLVPLAEEVLFRGLITSAWSRAGRPWTGLAISSVGFAVAHATVGGRTVVVTLLLGLVLGMALLASGTLAAPVLIHALFNAAALGESGAAHGGAGAIALLVTVVAVTLLAARMGATQNWLRPAGSLRLVISRRADALQPDG